MLWNGSQNGRCVTIEAMAEVPTASVVPLQVWAEGRKLVVATVAGYGPPRCVRCNRPTVLTKRYTVFRAQFQRRRVPLGTCWWHHVQAPAAGFAAGALVPVAALVATAETRTTLLALSVVASPVLFALMLALCQRVQLSPEGNRHFAVLTGVNAAFRAQLPPPGSGYTIPQGSELLRQEHRGRWGTRRTSSSAAT